MVHTKNIAIVGGGIVGSSVAFHLAQQYNGTDNLHITLNDPSGRFGAGAPYHQTAEAQEAASIYLANQPNNRMSIDSQNVNHFSEYLDSINENSDQDAFSPRILYGRYGEWLLQQANDTPRVTVETIREDISDIHRDNGKINVFSRADIVANADAVVLATGHQISPLLTQFRQCAGYFAPPENPLTVQKYLQDHNVQSVAIIGTSQTMVDWLRVLSFCDYQGSIKALSKRNILPWAFDPKEHPIENDRIDYTLKHLNVNDLQDCAHWNYEDFVTRLGQEISDAKSEKIGYGVLLSHVINAMETAHPDNAHAPYFTDYLKAKYSNPTPPESHQVMEDFRTSGQLEIIETTVGSDTIRHQDNRFVIDTDQGRFEYGALFNAAAYRRQAIGPDGTVYCPLLARMSEKDYIQADCNNPIVFQSGPQNEPGIFIADGPSTRSSRWGMETFRNGNEAVAESVLNYLMG